MTTFQKTSWEYKTLSQLGTIGRGKSKHRPRNDTILYGGKYPFIQTSDIKHSNFYVNSYTQTYNEAGLAQSKLWAKDTLCMTIAANIAETALLSFPACFPDSVVGFVADPTKSDVKFVKYALDYSKRDFQKTAKGTAQDNLSLEKIDSLKIKVPDIKTQSLIASVLSAYDDLIENNEKRIKMLEEMAQRLYTEWFVKFKFPGHEKTLMVNSSTEYGIIPKGWKVEKLEYVCSFISRGISPSYDEKAECIVINQKCIRNKRLNLEQSRRQRKTVPNKKIIRFGDILINSTGVGTLGRVAQVYFDYKNCTVDSHVSILRPSASVNYDYFGMSLLNLEHTLAEMGVGATGQTELSRSSIQSVEIIIPDISIQKEFSKLVSFMRKLSFEIEERNRVLSNMRDLLIPQLVTGKRIL